MDREIFQLERSIEFVFLQDNPLELLWNFNEGIFWACTGGKWRVALVNI